MGEPAEINTEVWIRVADPFSSLLRLEPPSLPAARAQVSSSAWQAQVLRGAWPWQASSGM